MTKELLMEFLKQLPDGVEIYFANSEYGSYSPNWKLEKVAVYKSGFEDGEFRDAYVGQNPKEIELIWGIVE